MNIHMNLFAYVLPDDLLRAFESINGPDRTIHLFLHSRVPSVVASCERIARHSNVVYHDYGFNRGLAKGINDSISAALDDNADMVICWADDMFARPGDVDRIAKAVLAHPECSYIDSPCFVEKTQRNERTGIAIGRTAIEKVGYFDENCDPIAFCDVDWMYRSRLLGMEPFLAEDTYLTHAGAKSRDARPEDEGQFMATFGQVRDYYVRKWGGDFRHEVYTNPFNDPKYGLKISRENSRNPYPEYAREDVLLPR